MTTNSSKVTRGQIIIGGILLILLILALVGFGLLLSERGTPPPIQGEPRKDQTTGLYTVYVLVSGHRDYTILHSNLHANIHVDFVSYYFQDYQSPPSGRSWMDFSKSIHVTVSVTGASLNSTLLNTFDTSASLGASWGQVLTYTLPPGNYSIRALGIDQDGFESSASAELVLH